MGALLRQDNQESTANLCRKEKKGRNQVKHQQNKIRVMIEI